MLGAAVLRCYVIEGILTVAVLIHHLEVEVRTEGIAGVTDETDGLTGAHLLSSVDLNRLQVGIDGD